MIEVNLKIDDFTKDAKFIYVRMKWFLLFLSFYAEWKLKEFSARIFPKDFCKWDKTIFQLGKTTVEGGNARVQAQRARDCITFSAIYNYFVNFSNI